MTTTDSVDDIVVGSTAKTWLSKQGLLPSSWGLESAEMKRILISKVRLTISCSPASVLHLSENTAAAIAGAHLVILDANSHDSGFLTRREVIAVALHEIGHVVNSPPENVPMSVQSIASDMERKAKGTAELEADDYARHCNYGAELTTSMEKYRKAGDAKFLTALADRRLKRIQDQEPPTLHFLKAH